MKSKKMVKMIKIYKKKKRMIKTNGPMDNQPMKTKTKKMMMKMINKRMKTMRTMKMTTKTIKNKMMV